MFYGHYRPTSREVLCFECLGDGCEKCEDLGVIILPEEKEKDESEFIPYYKRSKQHGLFESYVWLQKFKCFPGEGSWFQQSAKFINAVDWCDLVHAKWGNYRRERDKANESLNKQLGSMLGKK